MTPKKVAAPTSPEQIKKLRDAVAAAQLDANLAKAGMPVTVGGKRLKRQTVEARLEAAVQDLDRATAA